MNWVVRLVLMASLAVCSVAPGFAGGLSPRTSLHAPSVPVSAFARPADWLDFSRLHVSAEVMMGSGFGGQGVNGLQVTRLHYQVADPLSVRVSLGTAFGAQTAASGRSMFLEGLDLSYRPFGSLLVQFRYQDVRSPLQLSRSGAYDYWR